MNALVERKLEDLRDDYGAVVGQPFLHFYCPVLCRDENAELCQAHVVNQAFGNSSRRWTVQRKDVDNFFGSHFEADFIDLRHRGATIEQFIKDPSSTKSLRPQLRLHGQSVEFYLPDKTVPSHHSEIVVEGSSGAVRLAVKLERSELLHHKPGDWQIAIEKDCRVPALVSILKAAHLILFEMLGYRYALSAGGMFLGRSILGRFFLENRALPKKEVLSNAARYFSEYANLVRPVLSTDSIMHDTATDRFMYICEGADKWAFLVFVRTAHLVHAAIVPVLESPDAAARFCSFLAARGSTFQARLCQFDGEKYQVTPDTTTMNWPEARLLE